MCFKAKTPKLPPEPRVLTPQEADLKARDDTRRKLARRSGRRGTVLTSALGDPDFGSAARQRELLRGGGGGQ